MQFSTFVFSLALAKLSAAVAVDTSALSPRQSTTTCATLHTIALRGLAQEGNTDWYQFLIEPVNLINAAVEGSDSLGLVWDVANQDQIVALNNGTVELQQYVEQYAASCPNSKIAILGYSDGATSVSNAICGTSSLPYLPVLPLDASLANNVIATVVWGDLTHSPLQPWNRGTCPDIGLGITARLDNFECGNFAQGYQNYCDEGDLFCCASLDQSNDAHHTYQNFYTQSTADWVVQRYHDTTS